MPRGNASARQVSERALSLFSRHGVAGTSLQMIADELGVTKAAVYYRFRTKEQIVQAVLAPAFDGFDLLLAEVEQQPVTERPRLLIDGLARQAVVHRELYSVVLQDVTVAQLRRSTPVHRHTFQRLRDTLAGPEPTPESVVRAAIFLSGLTGPPADADLSTLDDVTLERAIVSGGYRLIGVRA